MTPNTESISPSFLRRQLSSYRRFLDDDIETQFKVDILLKLIDEELLIAKSIHKRVRVKAKDIEGDVNASRSTVLKYCKRLVAKKIAGRDSKSTEKDNIRPTFFFYIIDEKIKEILTALDAEGSETVNQDIKTFSIHKIDEISLDVTNDAACGSDNLASITQRISQLPPIAKQTLELIGTSGITAKSASEEIGCAFTTASKYLKEFLDAGWVTRNKDDARHGEFAYYLTDELSTILNVSPDKVQQKISEEIFMESANIPQQSTYQPKNSSFASRLKQWISLNHQIKEIEKDLIAREGSDAEELLADLRQQAF